jgi:uncharacterized membrane protein (UPF0127 family)
MLPRSSRPVSFRRVRHRVALASALVFAACSSGHSLTQTLTPPDSVATTTAVTFPGGVITAKIAATVTARDTGLMNVSSLAANSGMLFVFGVDHDSTTVAFWMKNTPLPLSIAFIDSHMNVVNVDDMAAESLTLHYPRRAFRYALEVNQGWLASHGVVAGTIVQFTLPAGTIIDP